MAGQDNQPTIGLIVNKTFKIVEQTYKKFTIIENDNVPWPEFYNKILNSHIADILFCGDSALSISHNQTLEKVVSLFTRFPYNIGAVYTDTNINTHVSFRKNVVFTTPIFLNGNINGNLFNTKLSIIYLYDALLKVSSKSVIYHIPEVLVHEVVDKRNITEDLKILQCQTQ